MPPALHIIARPLEHAARLRVIEAMRQVGATLVTEITAGNMNSRDGTLMLFASATHQWFARVTERGHITIDQPEAILNHEDPTEHLHQ